MARGKEAVPMGRLSALELAQAHTAWALSMYELRKVLDVVSPYTGAEEVVKLTSLLITRAEQGQAAVVEELKKRGG